MNSLARLILRLAPPAATSNPRSTSPTRGRTHPLTALAPATVLALLLGLPSLALAQPGHTAGLAALDDLPGLMAIVQQPDAPLAARARACQQLSLVGGAQSVPALAALLPDPKLSHYARTALEQIPDPAAAAALRAALDTVQGLPRIGIIHSLGVRRDEPAVPALVRLTTSDTPALANAALIALANIGTPATRDVLVRTLEQGPTALRAGAAEACLRLAERTRDADLFAKVLDADTPRPIQLAATRGLILTRGTSGVPLLLEALRASQPDQRNLALRVIRELPDPAASLAVAQGLPQLPALIQPDAVRALGDTGHSPVGGSIEALASAPALELRLASLEALGRLNRESSVPVLIAALTRATATDPREADVAASSLSRLKAPGVDSALVATLRDAAPEKLPLLVALLGQRGATSSTDAILGLATHQSPEVGRAAFEALTLLAQPADIPRLVEALANTREAGVRDRAEKALYNICLKTTETNRRGDALAAVYPGTRQPETRASLLQVMAMLGDTASCDRITAALEDDSATVRDTALRLLAHWNDATPVPTLLRVFKATPDDNHRSIALRGLVTLATQTESAPAKPGTPPAAPSRRTIAWLEEANAAIRNQPEEKRVLISGLGDLNCLEGVVLLAPYLQDDSVRTEAATALLRAARGLTQPGAKRAARPLVEGLAEDGPTAEIRRQAAEVLETLRK